MLPLISVMSEPRLNTGGGSFTDNVGFSAAGLIPELSAAAKYRPWLDIGDNGCNCTAGGG